MAEAITAEKIISNAQSWTFEGDCALLQWMKQISENLEERVGHTGKALNTLNANVKRTSIALDNAANSLNTLASLQFVENRVQEDDVATIKSKDVSVDKQTDEPTTSAEVLQQFLKNNLKMLHTCHEKYVVDFEDSDEEDNANNYIYQPKNPYNERLLPHIYGSKLWKENWHVGLCDTTNDYSGDEVSETFSESSKSAAEDNESFESNTEENLSEWASSTSNLNESKYPTHIAVENASSLRGSQPLLFPEAVSNISTRALSSSANTNSSSPAAVGGLNTSKARTYQHDLFATIQQETPPTLSSASSTNSSSEERNSSSAALKANMGDSAYEAHEPRFVKPSVAQVKRKPVNLFDDDDFNSFMTEIVDKAHKKSDASPPPVPAQRKLVSKPEEERVPAMKYSQIVENKAQTKSRSSPKARDISKTSEQAVNSKVPVDLFDETPKEKPTTPLNIPSKSMAARAPLNLFDSPPDDDLFVPSTRKTEIYAAESGAVPKTSITAQSLFDDEDDDDDFLNVFGTKKLTLPTINRSRPALFDDDDEGDKEQAELPKPTQTRSALFDDGRNTALPKAQQANAALFDDGQNAARLGTHPEKASPAQTSQKQNPTPDGLVNQTATQAPLAKQPLAAHIAPLLPPDTESNKTNPPAASTLSKLVPSDLFDDMEDDEDLFSKNDTSKPTGKSSLPKLDLFGSSDELFSKNSQTEVQNSSAKTQSLPKTSRTKTALFDDGNYDARTESQKPENVEDEVTTEQATQERIFESESSVNKLSPSITSDYLQVTESEKQQNDTLPPPGSESNIANTNPASMQPKLVLSDLFDDMEDDDDLFSKSEPKKPPSKSVVTLTEPDLFGAGEPTDGLFGENSPAELEKSLAKAQAVPKTSQTKTALFESQNPEEARPPPNVEEKATQEPTFEFESPVNKLTPSITSDYLQATTESEKQPLKGPSDLLPPPENNEANTAPALIQPKLVLSDLFDDIEDDEDLFSKKGPNKPTSKPAVTLAKPDLFAAVEPTHGLFSKNLPTELENSLTAADQSTKAQEIKDLGADKYQSIPKAENVAPANLESAHSTSKPPPGTQPIIVREIEKPGTSAEANQNDNFEFDFSIPENISAERVSTPKEPVPSSQVYSSLFLDEPPDDDGFFQSLTSKHLSSSKLTLNLEQDFEEPSLPEVPFSSKEVDATENSNYGGLHLFSEVPPDDDDFNANASFTGSSGVRNEPLTKETTRAYYDDFNETMEAVKQSQAIAGRPLHDIFSDEPPSDEEIFGLNKTSSAEIGEPSKDVTDRALKVVSKATGAVSKLPKININVQALLPNASGKPSYKKPGAKPEDISHIDDGDAPASTVKPRLSQETPKTAPIQGAPNLLSSACKTRVRGSVKRRPSTRQGRQENYRQSVLEAEREALLTQSVEEYMTDSRIASGREQLIAKSRQSRVDDKMLENPYGLPVTKKTAAAVGDIFASEESIVSLSASNKTSVDVGASRSKSLEEKSRLGGSSEIQNPNSKLDFSDLFPDESEGDGDSIFNKSVSQVLSSKDEQEVIQKKYTPVVEKPLSAPPILLAKSIENEQEGEDKFSSVKIPASEVPIHDLVLMESGEKNQISGESLPKQPSETSKRSDEVPHRIISTSAVTVQVAEIFKTASATPEFKSNLSQEPTKANEKKSVFNDLFADGDNDEENEHDFLFKPKLVKAEVKKELLETEKRTKQKEKASETKAAPKGESENKLVRTKDGELPEAADKLQPAVLPTTTQPQQKTEEQPKLVKNTQLFVDSFSDEDDLFSTNTPILKKANYSTEAIKTATTKAISSTKAVDSVPKSSELKPSKPTRSKAAATSLFDEQSDTDEDDLFRAVSATNKNPPKSNKQVTMPVQKSLFGSENESDGEDFSKTSEHQQKPTQKIVKSLPTEAIKQEQPQQQAALKTTKQTGKSLFSDIESEDDDDLFGGGVAKTGANKNTVKAPTKTSNMAKAVRDPLLTGPQQPSTTKLKPTTSISTVADNPLADLLNN